MPLLNIPSDGISLPSQSMRVAEDKTNPRAVSKVPFGIKINVTERFLDELFNSKKTGKKVDLTLVTGKQMALHIGNQMQFEVGPTTENVRNDLYKRSSDDNIIPLGAVAHKFEVMEADERNMDEDMLKLKNDMEAINNKKKIRSVIVVDPSKLGPELSGRKGVLANRKAGLPPNVLQTKTKRGQFTVSTPSSPALNATSSSSHNSVTSVPRKAKNFKKDPLFFPLIHLLALGGDKERNLAMKTHTSINRVNDMLIHVADRNSIGQWELFDNIYKDLDVWRFPYPSQELRDWAIENAHEAFDKLKMEDNCPERELLRRPEDRGKPIPPRQKLKPKPKPKEKPVEKPVPKPSLPQSSPIIPPTIKISKDDSAAASPALSAEPMARTASQPTPQSKHFGDAANNAIKKIIGKKSGAKTKATPAAKTTAQKEKKSTTKTPTIPTASVSASATPSIGAGKSPAATAPTQRKRGGASTKYKSEEYIVDSDSDTDVPLSQITKKMPPAKTAQKSTPQSESRPQNVPSKRPPAISVAAKHEAAANNSASVNGNHKYTKSMSASPSKPSPLGSSPPLTASDLVRQSSTASSSPLSSCATPDDLVTPPIHTSAYTSVPNSAPKSSAETGSSRPRYIPTNHDSASPQHKRKADEDNVDRPRKRVMSSSSEDSDLIRKRKIEEDRATYSRKAPKLSETSDDVPRKQEKEKRVTNGVSAAKKAAPVSHHQDDSRQRMEIRRVNYASSTTSNASSVSVASSLSVPSSDSSTRTNRYKVQQHSDGQLELLSKYKRLHIQYQNKYERVQADPNASEEEFMQVMDLHRRLSNIKTRIQSMA